MIQEDVYGGVAIHGPSHPHPLCEYSGGLVQPDRRIWCTASGEMVHRDRADGARPPHLILKSNKKL